MADLGKDELIDGLDGSRVSNEEGSWSITVYSAQTLDDHRWLQLGLIGDRDYAVTFRIPLAAQVTDARSAIAAWLRNPADHHGDIISLA